ncbi:sugar phosphate isomerase/epimerase family protein [Neolewinella sp.]|uniref:sugar phosphate isomerase/epimerase family protein n=1 Tax=Neolewinella sp. TaxID=2993543 RepID=UPI003B52EE0A
MSSLTRRHFLRQSATLATLPLLPIPALRTGYGKPDSRIKGVQIGTITYSYRSMPDQSAEAILGYVVDSGISAVELMGEPAENFAGAPEVSFDRGRMNQLRRRNRDDEPLTEEEQAEYDTLSQQAEAYNRSLAAWRATADMQKFTQLRKLYATAGVSIYAFKPSTFGQSNSEKEIDYGMRAARALGADHVTLEHPADDAQTAKLGRIAARHDIRVAYHGHTQQTPTFWDTALAQSPHNAMNLDIGHYVAAGNTDALELVRAHHHDIASMHLKDRRTPAGNQENMPWGEGDTPVAEILQLMAREKYTFPATIELEYTIPEGSNAVQEVAKCLAYCRQSLA